MKSSLRITTVTLCLVLSLDFLRAQSLPVLSSAVGWWAGDGDTTDRLASHPGQFVGTERYAKGMVGDAFSFDGVSSHVSIADAPDLNFTNQMTVEAWIKPYGHTGSFDPVLKKSGSDQARGFAFEFGGDVIILYVYLGGWVGAGGTHIPNNQWSHVAGTYDGNQINVYVNGELVGSAAASGAITPTSAPLFLGSDPSNPDRHFYGLIDEATVYSTALSADDIRSIYLAGSAGKGNGFRFISPGTIPAQTNSALSIALQVSGGTQPYHWSTSEARLPDGVALSDSGVLQGTPSETGEFRFGVTVLDATNGIAQGYATIRIPIPAIAYPVPSGVVAWWPFNDLATATTLEDRVGNHTGAKANNPTSVPGMVGQALQFNGVDQYVAVQDASDLQFGNNDFSIEMWARFDAAGGGSMGEPSHIFIGSSDGPGARNKWIFALGGGYLEFIAGSETGASTFIPLDPFNPVVGQWYHLAFVRGGNTFATYINGSSVGVATNAVTIPKTTTPVTIGQSEFIGLFNGAIDEPTVYSRALRPEEVRAIATSSYAGKTAGMSITPAYGGKDGEISVHIKGAGFGPGATVQLVRNGETGIIGAAVTVATNGTSLDAIFDLHGKTVGLWDVLLTNPITNSIVLPGGFEIQERQAPALWANIVGLGLIRPGRSQQFNLFYGNQGNVDSGGGIIWISGLPTNASVDVRPVLPAVAPPDPRLRTNEAATAVFDLNGQRTIMLMVKRIGPAVPSSVAFSLNIPTFESMDLDTWIYTDPDYEPPLILKDSNECTCICCANPADQSALEEALDIAWQDWPRDNLFSQAFNDQGLCIGAAANLFGDLAQAGLKPGSALSGWGIVTVNGGTKVYPNGRREHNSTMLISLFTGDHWLIDDSAFPQICKMVSVGSNEWSTTGCDWQKSGYVWAPDNEGPGVPCRLPQRQGPLHVDPVGSYDPNNMVGPSGIGTEHFLSDRTPIAYSISFENEATATAPAQEVQVIDTLDPYKVDVGSVQLGEIHFGTNVVRVPSGMSSFSTTIDLRTNQNLLVAIDCSLDPNAAILSWHFRSLDPETMEPPTDPTAGFLPPNSTPPGGEGSYPSEERAVAGSPGDRLP